MIVRFLILLLFIFPGFLSGQSFLDRHIALNVKDMPLRYVLDQISENNGVYFTYTGNLKAMEKLITLRIENVPLNKLLNDFFYGEDLVYSCYSNQIIIKKKPETIKSFRIRGMIVSSDSDQPVEFASVQMRKSKKGAVAGFDGKFEISVTSEEVADSISIYRIGYEARTMSVRALSSLEFHKIFLTPVSVPLDTVGVTVKKAHLEKEGNRGVHTGSLYLDTHGQQVALLLKNKKGTTGRIKTLSFFLSGKGNTEAPFRIRIYGLNDSLGCPGPELLPDILVVKPASGRGWFDVDVSHFNIRFPESGIFVAMEGIYPGDYINSYENGTENKGGEAEDQGDFIEGSLEYGQRIGYNRFSKNETWHYSVSHTWFQLRKKLFNVMISAEIIVYDPHKNKKIKL